jgi:hypothetical protein
VKVKVVNGPTVAWLVPKQNACLRTTTRLAVVSSSNRKLRTAAFFNGKKKIGSRKPDTAGLAFADWKVKNAGKGKHVLRATVRDARGRTATARRTVRVC